MLDPRAPEHEIAAMACHLAGRVRTLLYSFEVRTNGMPLDTDALVLALDAMAIESQARAVSPSVRLSGRIGRMLDAQWWVRNLRRELLRENEAAQQSQGNIRRSNDCYVSEHAISRKRTRANINRLILEAREIVNEEGLALNLAEVVDKSVSSPKLQRAELMVRSRGFEEAADYAGHLAVFLTITCPSRFHRFSAGKLNPRWTAESTPKDAQKYLCKVWQRIRAKWHRLGITPYGFRVVEPHHDGCPHWHLLLFLPEEQLGSFSASKFLAGDRDFGSGLLGAAGQHALADSGNEKGAVKRRFKWERIDRTKGSATGYLAKYICKNIDGLKDDGESIGLDFASGTKAVEASTRVKVFSSLWGIRQFQQIGGPSVVVYRELRRMANDAQQPVLSLDLFEGPRSAADRGMWALFWILQGGPDVARKDLTLRPMVVKDECSGRYGDDVNRVRGVLGRDDELGGLELPLETRVHTWTIQTSGQAKVDAEMYQHRYALATRAKHPEFWAEMQKMEAKRNDPALRCGEAAAPWTGVNNCTQGHPPPLPTEAGHQETPASDDVPYCSWQNEDAESMLTHKEPVTNGNNKQRFSNEARP